jgi:cytochrome c oxidase subunit 2
MLSTLAAFWMPERASTYAGDVDWLFYFIVWLSTFFVVLIAGLMVYFALRYRQTDRNAKPHGSHHNNMLEITWSAIPLLLVLAIFVWGFRGFLNMSTTPANAEQVLVQAQQWRWEFQYANGATSTELHVPVDRPIELVLQSADVIHSFYVPAFRIKKDVVPGRYNKTWFRAPQTGEYDLYCAEYCGQQHAQMLTKVVVQSEDEFAAWMTTALDVTGGLPPAELGARLFEKKGCNQCHAIEPTMGAKGPPWRDLFGKQQQMADGSVVAADEAYVRESILYPAKKIVAGYNNEMSPYVGRIKDVEITAIIEYMKSISANYQGQVLQAFPSSEGESQPPASAEPAAEPSAEQVH